ncbi:MAG: HAD-IIIA family hydrolase [Candidatus Staskawiczbacteria bacterium]|nr:HAD-IIIA family hydrolase [Candidatus Staskawiczbacteria bacterium]MBI3337642.1 HAD-IIIA family hydrolase [Candidatus Staskawiczbacteria bacterium]
MILNLFSKIMPSYRFGKLINMDINIFLNKSLIIFDVDNTLVFSEGTETKKEIIDWFKKINENYKCICLSNSRTIKKRKDKISKLLGCQIFLSIFKKPSKKLFKSIKDTYNVEASKVIIVGDRIFPDILFGNLNGAVTVLVEPINNKENILIRIIRKIERFSLFLIDSFGYNKK